MTICCSQGEEKTDAALLPLVDPCFFPIPCPWQVPSRETLAVLPSSFLFFRRCCRAPTRGKQQGGWDRRSQSGAPLCEGSRSLRPVPAAPVERWSAPSWGCPAAASAGAPHRESGSALRAPVWMRDAHFAFSDDTHMAKHASTQHFLWKTIINFQQQFKAWMSKLWLVGQSWPKLW